jgi:hypothetical protein
MSRRRARDVSRSSFTEDYLAGDYETVGDEDVGSYDADGEAASDSQA